MSLYPEAQARLPLLERQLEDAFALRQSSVGQAPIRVAEFIGQVLHLAEQLPPAAFVINLCDNRYLFTLAFCAALVRGQTNLLPQNRTLATQALLHQQYPDSYVLHDGLDKLLDNCPQYNLSDVDLQAQESAEIPQIRAEFLAAIAFTSGSTGQPKANLKPWHTFVVSSRMNALAMRGPAHSEQLSFALATVPAQHMWGLETSLLLPLFSRLCISDSRPLFPLDIIQALSALPRPRLLISTPVHLRSLLQSGLDLPQVEQLLCATAPLSRDLAQGLEAGFKGQLTEVYGCSEVGSMASRRSAQSDSWQLFPGLHFSPDLSLVSASHLPQPQPLQDQISCTDGRQFRLLGRAEDMLEIAGKRGSLLELNKILLSAEGVLDGVVFMPEAGAQAVTRPVALVVAREPNKAALQAAFAERLDPVFTPRPLLFVDALPREENGKLPRAKLLAFYQSLRQQQQQ